MLPQNKYFVDDTAMQTPVAHWLAGVANDPKNRARLVLESCRCSHAGRSARECARIAQAWPTQRRKVSGTAPYCEGLAKESSGDNII